MSNPATTPEDNVRNGMSPLSDFLVRVCDVIIAGVCLVVFSPLFLYCYIAVRKEDGGPGFYKQERIGKGGRPFYIYKFRSMRTDAEKNGEALCLQDEEDRTTRIGKRLRDHHLDELPQLWNVMKGDMAFVGYRPERQYFIDQIMRHDARYACLYQIRPGVTSEATLRNGYTDTMDKMLVRLAYDLEYLQKRSFATNIRILVETFLSIVTGKKF